MASEANLVMAERQHPITAVTGSDRMLAFGAVAIFVATVIAIFRGQADWPRIPTFLWLHLLTILVAVALTPVMLLRRRGDRLHRQLGWVWVGSMLATALLTFNLRLVNDGEFSFIHILSFWTAVQVPLIVMHARAHRVEKHRSAVRGMVLGALLIAGFFTFPFDRLLGNWLFG